MPVPSKIQPEETYAAFRTEEPFKMVARRFGLSPNTLRRWWVAEFGHAAFVARGRTTIANGKVKAGLIQRVMIVEGKKRCTKCGKKKWLRLFNVRATSHDGHTCWCRSCYRKYSIAKEKECGYSRKRQSAKREWLNSLKTQPCTDCGRSFPPFCMDFDHVQGEKVGDVGSMFAWSRKRVLAEIEKCDLVCACCHRIRTNVRKQNSSQAGGRPRLREAS